ncbi:MAG: DEAD/DEAH box helicase family protein [Alphaproteobacteria bacterium]|nr:DEAD/DEAH box helicase family protein [Alphaproteobacteria bacterium]
MQSMVNLYAEYSSGYFDLIISDECHRSIYGQWSGVLKHFDGIQLGLTATPCKSTQVEDSDEDQAFVRDNHITKGGCRFLHTQKSTPKNDWLSSFNVALRR